MKSVFPSSARLRRLASLSVAAAALAAGAASAATFTEVGDAGQTQATAQAATGSGALTDIFGVMSSALDADLFIINITNVAAFSATTSNAYTTVFDTQLFLLTLAGAPVYLNDDDAGGLTALSTLAAGSSLGPLTPGLYILGVSESGYDPVNAATQLLFANGLSTSLRGPTASLQPAVLGGFFDNTYASDSGNYRIQLTGVSAVPEPATSALALLGASALGLWAAKRRRQHAA